VKGASPERSDYEPENPDRQAVLATDDGLCPTDVPSGVDRRTFMMRSAVIGSAAVITGCTPTAKEQTAAAPAPPPQVKENVSPDLDVVRSPRGRS
jgi:hypothetical protein